LRQGDGDRPRAAKRTIAVSVVVHLPSPLVPFADGQRRVELPGRPATAGEALDQLFLRYPGLRHRIADERGRVRPHVNIFVGADNIRDAQGLETRLGAQAEVHVLAAVSGGCAGPASRARLWLVVLALAAAATALRGEEPPATAPFDPKTLRGLEQEGELVDDPGRTLANALLLLPRDIVNGVLASTAYGTEPTDDPKLIERAEDVFPLRQKAGVFPRFDFSSQSGLAAGANLYYRGRRTGAIVSGVFRRARFWNASAILGWQKPQGHSVLKLSFVTRLGSDDAYRFFGLGADPGHDPRAPVLPEAPVEFGRYVERYDSTSIVAGMRTPMGVELYYETNYRRRTIEDLPDSDEALGRRFDLAALPGLGTRKQWYNELSFRYDTRRYRGVAGPGLTVASYVGLSSGLGDDESRFGRAGGELLLHLPVFRGNRLLVPKLSVDHVWNRQPDVPLSFADYPRHFTYRGVGARRTILRTDNWVFVPSLEYQWALTYRTQAILFYDMLVVAPSIDRIRATGSPWATGLALEMHSPFRSLARLVLAGGSEGFRVGIELNPPVKTNDRTRWN
jgi:sulfur-carrier protein